MEIALTTEQPPIRIEVSRPRLFEGGPGVLRVRVVNVTAESLTCTLGIQGALTDAWRDTPTLLPPNGTAERRVPTRGQTRGSFLIHVSADIEGVDGSTTRFAGQIDREVEALASGPAAISVNIAGGDGAVIDASHLGLGQIEEVRRVGRPLEYESVELAAVPIRSVLQCATLADNSGSRLHLVTGDRLVIGRDPEQADLLAEGDAVSRVHAEIANEGGRFVVRHRSRTNETRLNEARVTGERPVILSDDHDSTLLLGGMWRCLVRAIRGDGTAASVQRGLVERGVPVGSSNAGEIAGLLLTHDGQSGPEFVPVLWLKTAVRLGETGLDDIEDRDIVLSAFHGLQEVLLADDGRVLSVSDLRSGARVAARYRVIEEPR